MIDLRRVVTIAAVLGLGAGVRAQDPAEAPTDAVPGMVVAPTALPPLGQRTPDALILARPDVQDDLRLSPEQRRKFARFGAAARDRQAALDAEANATNQNVFSPLPMQAIESLEFQQAAADDEVESGIAALLTRPQRARFAQIRLQLDGPMAFARNDLLERLNLDDDQAEAIRGVLATARDEMVQNAQFPLTTRDVPRRDGRRPRSATESERSLEEQLAEARVANERVRDAAFGRINRILRKHQWDAYLKLRGAPFTPSAPVSAPGFSAVIRSTPRTHSREATPPAGEPD